MRDKLFKSLLFYFLCSNIVFGAQTPSDYFTATMSSIKTVTIDPSGATTATMNSSTGALSNALTPSFFMTTNTATSQPLTFSATVNTQGGNQNAVFNISSNKYIILSNSSYLPPLSSITNIKSGNPSAANNPDAIAYTINDPTSTTGLTVSYNATNQNWDLVLSKKGQTGTSATITTANPLANTYSQEDTAGNYQATITLTFN